MKKALLIVIAFFAWAMASCTKENDSGNNSGNGNGNGSGNGGNNTEQINYSYGYYHPAKKVKKVSDFFNGGELEFVWNGDDLSSINYSSWHDRKDLSC